MYFSQSFGWDLEESFQFVRSIQQDTMTAIQMLAVEYDEGE
jgi:hypothetical protein